MCVSVLYLHRTAAAGKRKSFATTAESISWFGYEAWRHTVIHTWSLHGDQFVPFCLLVPEFPSQSGNEIEPKFRKSRAAVIAHEPIPENLEITRTRVKKTVRLVDMPSLPWKLWLVCAPKWPIISFHQQWDQSDCKSHSKEWLPEPPGWWTNSHDGGSFDDI